MGTLFRINRRPAFHANPHNVRTLIQDMTLSTRGYVDLLQILSLKHIYALAILSSKSIKLKFRK